MTEVAGQTEQVTQETTVTSTEGVSTPEQTTEAAQTPGNQANPEIEKPKRRDGGFQRRIDQLTRDKYQLEAQLRAERESRQQPEQPKGEPKREQFETLDEYLEAKAVYAGEVAADKHFKKIQESQRRQSAETHAKTLADNWATAQEKARDDIEDYDDVINGSTAPISKPMLDAVMESDIGPRIVYHLAQHPEDAERISRLSAMSAAREIGRIEASLLAAKRPAPKPVETKPIAPVGASAAASEGPNDKQSINDWMAARNKEVRARRGF